MTLNQLSLKDLEGIIQHYTTGINYLQIIVEHVMKLLYEYDDNAGFNFQLQDINLIQVNFLCNFGRFFIFISKSKQYYFHMKTLYAPVNSIDEVIEYLKKYIKDNGVLTLNEQLVKDIIE